MRELRGDEIEEWKCTPSFYIFPTTDLLSSWVFFFYACDYYMPFLGVIIRFTWWLKEKTREENVISLKSSHKQKLIN